MDEKNQVFGETSSRGGKVTYYFRELPANHIPAVDTTNNLCPDVKKALKALPTNSANTPKNTIKPRRNPSSTFSIGEITPTTDDNPSLAHLSPNIQKVMTTLSVEMPKLYIYRQYERARKFYKKKMNYYLIPAIGKNEFFLSEPVRILIALIPPELVHSIITHTNKYSKEYKLEKGAKLTVISFFEYLCLILDTLGCADHSIEGYFYNPGHKPIMSKRRFKQITSWMQFNEHYLYNTDEAPADYKHDTQLTGCVIDISIKYASWMMDVVGDISVVVIDESRIKFKQNEPLTANSNPLCVISLKKPDPVAFQIHTLNEARSNLLLNFLPTMALLSAKLDQTQFVPKNANEATAVVNYLVYPLPPSTDDHQILILADGYYGSLESSNILWNDGYLSIARVNRNSNGVPLAVINGVQCGHNEYVRTDLVLEGSDNRKRFYATRSGSGKSNLVLSTVYNPSITGEFSVKHTKTGKRISVQLTAVHSLYKTYANAADIANQYIANLRTHLLYKTTKFKTRLFHYFFGVFFSQTRIVFKILQEQQGITTPSNEYVPIFYRSLAESLRRMLHAEHHYAISARYTVDQATVKKYFKRNIYKFIRRKGKRHHVQHMNPSPKCSFSQIHKECGPVYRICLPCLATNKTGKPAFVCKKCYKKNHTRSLLIKRK